MLVAVPAAHARPARKVLRLGGPSLFEADNGPGFPQAILSVEIRETPSPLNPVASSLRLRLDLLRGWF
jgi:hypothetical protein